MANKRNNLVWLIGGAVVLLGIGLTLKSLSSTSGPRVYAAKFVCGTMSAKMAYSQLPPFGGALNPGKYTTSVNIQNAGNTTVKIAKVAMQAPREPAVGTATSSLTLELPGRSATAADCPDIYSLLYGTASTSVPYIEGFLDIYSNSNLNVTAVYTGQNLNSSGAPQDMSTMDVEKIQPEAIP